METSIEICVPGLVGFWCVEKACQWRYKYAQFSYYQMSIQFSKHPGMVGIVHVRVFLDYFSDLANYYFHIILKVGITSSSTILNGIERLLLTNILIEVYNH